MTARRRYHLQLGGLAVAALLCTDLLAESGLHFTRVGTEGGPPPSVITAVHQDNAGFIWIGSRDGLTLYDGHSFVVFEHEFSDPSSISDNTIRTIYEDRSGGLWLGTNTGGLNRLDRGSWKADHYRHDSSDPNSISHDSIYAILEDHTGALWVGTQQGLNRFDRETRSFERFLAAPGVPGSLSNDYIMALLEDEERRLWIGTLGGGLHLWDPATASFQSFRHDPRDPRSLTHDDISSLLADPSGSLWVATVEGLNLFDPESGRSRRFVHDTDDPTSLSDPLVTSLAAGPEGELWVGTHGGGLNKLEADRKTFRHWRNDPNRRDSLADDKIIDLLADDRGNLWIGTWGGGLNRLNRTSLLLAAPGTDIIRSPDLEDDDVTCLLRDRRGGLWVGTRSGYLYRVENGRPPRRFLRGGRQGMPRILLDLLEGRTGLIWVATNGGLVRIDPRTGAATEFEHDPGDDRSLGPGYVRSILEDSQGRLWVGTGEGGLQQLDTDGRVLARYLHDPADPGSISDNYVTALIEDAQARLWVGTRSRGLNVFDPSTGTFVRHLPDADDAETLSHHYVTSIFEDSRGTMWVATGGGGLNRVDRDEGTIRRFVRLTERDALIDNDVMGVLEDSDGSLWLSTKQGLSRFSPGSGASHRLRVSDGLPTGEFELGAVARGGENLYFGSVSGLVTIPAGTGFPSTEPSPVVVRALRSPTGDLNEGRAPWDLGQVEIPYGERIFVEFAVLDYGPERSHRYAYRLGEVWTDLDDRREITFSGLPPGTHELLARGRNSQGVWNEIPRPLKIRVVPPFWMTLWFRILTVLVIAAAAVGVHFARISTVERRNRELLELHRQREKARDQLAEAYERLRKLTRRLEAAKEDERKHIARELHDDMGPALTAVIINLQLLSQDPDPKTTAKRYAETIELVDRLVQQVRDLSLDLRPPLLDELGLVPALSGYLEAQSERSGIEVEIRGKSAAEGLAPEVAILVFRVIQEAVTNVVRHAEATRADVHVLQKNSHLVLTVEDDGRGFDVAETLKGTASGKALGLLGMQERVRMMNGDLELESTPGAGTIVRVRVPLGNRS